MPILSRSVTVISPKSTHLPALWQSLVHREKVVWLLILITSGCFFWSKTFAAEPVIVVEQIPDNPQQEKSSQPLEPNQVDVHKSRVYIFVDKTGLGHQHGVEGRLSSGTVKLGALEDGGEFVFDMKSFDADTDAARRYLGLSGSTDASTRQQVNQNMRAASILNVNQFPTAKFAIKSASALNQKSRNGRPLYELSGEFTLRGRTQPLKFEAEVETKDGMAHVKGQFAILQTQYGMTPFRKALGAVGVADRLVIHGDLWVALEPESTGTR